MRHRVPDLGPLIPAQLGHHALFAISVAALAGAGLRAASLAAPAGLDRVVAAVSLAAAAAVIEALALGLAGLGTHPLAATATAVATWVAARRWLPVPDRALRSEFVNWWRGAGAPKRLVVGTVVGLVLAMVAWSLDSPDVGIDGTYYHLPEIVAWVHNGRPGSIEEVTYVYPVGNFPATNEIVLAWSLGLSRSFVPIALWTPFMLALVVAAGWLGLRSLRVPTLPAALAIAAVCSLPAMIDQLNGPLNDVPALAWLVSAAALSAASASRPALLAPAAVAAGLSAGTKTTTLPLAALVLVLGLIAHRRRLRGLALPLGLAAVAALIVGGTSYVRNLVDHGSPFWPWGAAPRGDPATTFIDETFYS